MKNFALVVALAAVLANLPGCATISDDPAPADFPKLTIYERYVSFEVMNDVCRKYVGAFSAPVACATLNFKARGCDIWLVQGAAPQFVIEHEREHCAGKDHPGESNIRDAWERYKKENAL